MRKSRFTEEQIRLAVQQAEAGLDLTELCRKYGVSQATFYRWRSKYGALSRTFPDRRQRPRAGTGPRWAPRSDHHV